MSERDPRDELQIHVEDMRQRPQPSGTWSGARSLLYPPRTPRQRIARRALFVCLLALALGVALAGIPSLRLGLTGLIRPLLPAPAPTLAPGGNHFYLTPNPPGVDVLLDGHVLSAPSSPGDPHPLTLSRGRHTFTWRSTHFPAQPLSCVVSVPADASADTCPLDPAILATEAPGYVIRMSLSLETLRQEQAQALAVAIHDTLAATWFTAVVQPGEHYALDALPPRVATATAPLRATLSFEMDLQGNFFPEPCIFASGILPCRFPDQDCSQLCTVPAPLAAGLGSPDDWIAAVGVQPSWTYTAQDGRKVAGNVADPINTELIVLRISWDGAQWHVVPIFGHTATLPATDDAACDSALALLAGTTWSFMVTSPPPSASLSVASDPSPADGCVVVVVNHGTPEPVFLARFGVLLTVNDSAVNLQDGLPVANAAEQQLARQLMSLSSASVPPS